MKKLFLFICLSLIVSQTFANNISVTNASLSGQNTTNDTYDINFDVAWENSWRTSTNESNYDGAWVFVKFRKNGTGAWLHATINTTGFTAASGAAISVPADKKGVFIHRSTNGIGNVNFTGNKLVWDYAADGALDTDTYEIKVFALEIVYIPQGDFFLGSGGTETYSFRDGNTNNPFKVTSAQITWGNAAPGTLAAISNIYVLTTGTLQASFPTGYKAFWIMKYETSQQQFVDFLNHLDLAKATYNNTPGYTIGTHPSIIASAPEQAQGGLNTSSTTAMADWSGLRICSEMEFEKTCRGVNIAPVTFEYAWGTTSNYPATAVTGALTATETPSAPVNANSNLASPLGRGTRVGMFARATSTTREGTGATYYGVMNMSDNLYEIYTTTANAGGRAYSDVVHGNGYLAANGQTDITNWQDRSTFGVKGGQFNSGTAAGQVSDRSNTNSFIPADYAFYGSRLGRTAP
jgi:formylglycine-generating enzyme required for sulfatase activity